MSAAAETTTSYSTWTRGYALGGAIAYIVTTTLLGVVLARVLDPDELGLWFVLMSASNLLHAVMVGGAPPVMVRRLATGTYSAASVVRSALRASAIFTVVVAVLVLWPLGPLLTSHMSGNPAGSFTYLLIIMSVLLAVQRFVAEAFRGLHEIVAAVSLNGFIARGLALLVFAQLAFADGTSSLGATAAVQAVTTAVVIVAIVAYKRRALSALTDSRGDDGSFTVSETRPLLLSNVMSLGVQQGDLVIAAFFLTAAEVASYGVALHAATLLMLPLHIVNSIATPMMARDLHHRSDRLQNEVARLAMPAGIAALIGCALIIVFGRAGLRIAFGAEYLDAYPVLVILAVSQLLSTATGPCGSMLVAGGHDRVVARTSLAAVIVIVVAGSALAYSHGMVGLAIGSAIATVMQNLVNWYYARRLTGIRTDMLVLPHR